MCRSIRHEDWGLRHGLLQVQVPKSKCLTCGRGSRQLLAGILRCQRASEAFQKAIYQQHLDGINRSRLGRREGIGAATVERYFRRGLQRQFREWHPPRCPLLLGIDEHFFTRKKGYATTFCDLGNHKVYDVVLGRSEAALEAYLARLPQLVQLGDTLDAWREEIAAMWRFSKNNGITEGFHNKIELISRQAYGFRNFENYRFRVKVLGS